MLSVTRPVGSWLDRGKVEDSEGRETRIPSDFSAACDTFLEDDLRLEELLSWSSFFGLDFGSLVDGAGVDSSFPSG